MADFDPDEYLKSKAASTTDFDPDQYLASKQPKEEVGPIEAGIRGFGQSFFGIGDEVTAALRTGSISSPEYRAERDRQRQFDEQAWQEHPAAYGTGYVSGAGVQMLVPPLNVAKGASWTKAALQGTAMGAGQALGSSEADLTKGNLDEYIQAGIDTGIGAVTGGLLGAGSQALSNKLGQKAVSKAEQQAGITPKMKQTKPNTPTGEQLIEDGAIPFSFSKEETTKGIIARAEKGKEEAGKRISDLYEIADDNFNSRVDRHLGRITKISDKLETARTTEEKLLLQEGRQMLYDMLDEKVSTAKKIADNLRKKADELSSSPFTMNERKVLNKYANEFDRVYKESMESISNPNIGHSPKDLWNWNKQIDKKIFGATKRMKGTEGLSMVRDTIKEQVRDSMYQELGDVGKKELDAANKAYSKWATTFDAAISKASRSEGSDDKSLIGLLSPIATSGAGIRTMYFGSKVLPKAIAPTAKAGANIVTPTKKKEDE